MAEDYCFAGYPAALLYKKPGGKVHYQLLWGRYIGLTGETQGQWLEVERGSDRYWVKRDETQKEGILRIIFVDIGQGDGCLVTTPDNKQIVIDAGDSDNMFRFLKYKFGGFKRTVNFQSFIISHPDKDHYGGFRGLIDHDKVKVGTIFHSGIVERNASSTNKQLGPRKKFNRRSYLTELIADRDSLDALLTPARIGRKKYPALLRDALNSGRVADFRMLNENDGFLPGYEKRANRDLHIEVLGPVPEFPDAAKPDNPHLRWLSSVSKTKNGHSVVLRLVYKDISILLGGDLNIKSEDYLLEHYTGEAVPPRTAEDEERLIAKARQTFECDFAKACHHGSADFTELYLKAVNAKATVISSGDEEPHAHPRADTLGTIGKHGHGRRPLIFSTELSRSAKEKIKNPKAFRQEIRDAVDRIAEANRTGRKLKSAQNAYEKALKKIERSISTYGAINLRTDGEKAVLAYKIEAPRSKSRIWDIYKFERDPVTEEMTYLSKY